VRDKHRSKFSHLAEREGKLDESRLSAALDEMEAGRDGSVVGSPVAVMDDSGEAEDDVECDVRESLSQEEVANLKYPARDHDEETLLDDDFGHEETTDHEPVYVTNPMVGSARQSAGNFSRQQKLSACEVDDDDVLSLIENGAASSSKARDSAVVEEEDFQ